MQRSCDADIGRFDSIVNRRNIFVEQIVEEIIIFMKKKICNVANTLVLIKLCNSIKYHKSYRHAALGNFTFINLSLMCHVGVSVNSDSAYSEDTF